MTKRNSAQRAWMAEQIGETTMRYIEQLECENAELKTAAARGMSVSDHDPQGHEGEAPPARSEGRAQSAQPLDITESSHDHP